MVLLRWLAESKNSVMVVEALPKLELVDLAEINSMAGIGI